MNCRNAWRKSSAEFRTMTSDASGPMKYLGFIIDQDSRHPDPDNIDATKQMPLPKDVDSLRSFLGVMIHYSSFLPEMHRLRHPMNEIFKKDVKWALSRECQQSFEEVKTMLSSGLLLTDVNPDLKIILAADASNYGIGAVISHIFHDNTEKTICPAARSLTSAERNYGPIEKKALAIIFAVKKFQKMLYGHHFTFLTDHKPLLSIFGSNRPSCVLGKPSSTMGYYAARLRLRYPVPVYHKHRPDRRTLALNYLAD
ncbi:unnamed protein product [Schistocephalus solidus]|uniref:RT_RNaseH_2 domain-containing protein n=1 Tax=Schistocephalus solidus TaxID=70667 RepID=A0A183SZP1_SCHSO|nr:unnamed protein product [Schistocephalus solidus]